MLAVNLNANLKQWTANYVLNSVHYLNLIKFSNRNLLRLFLINKNLAIVFGLVPCCYILALVLTCFRPMKDRATYFRT